MKTFGKIKQWSVAVFLAIIVGFASGLFMFVPVSRGLFTVAEPLIFVLALLSGPYVGAFVGGVGSALASYLLGYPHYVVASLTVKASAGFMIGWIIRLKQPTENKLLSIVMSLILILFFGLAGVKIYSGDVYFGYVKTFFLGENVLSPGGLQAYGMFVPEWFWVISSATIAAYIILCELKSATKLNWASIALLSGCSVMIFGYFLYETFLMPTFFGVTVDPVANITTNAGQSILSATIALILGRTFMLKR